MPTISADSSATSETSLQLQLPTILNWLKNQNFNVNVAKEVENYSKMSRMMSMRITKLEANSVRPQFSPTEN